MSTPAAVSPAGTLHVVQQDHPDGPYTACGLPVEPDWSDDLDTADNACDSCMTPADLAGARAAAKRRADREAARDNAAGMAFNADLEEAARAQKAAARETAAARPERAGGGRNRRTGT